MYTIMHNSNCDSSTCNNRFSRFLHYLLGIALCCLCATASKTEAQDNADLTPKEILARIKARATKIRTVYLVASWEDYSSTKSGHQANLQRSRWEHQTIYSDNFNRIRVTMKQGTFDVAGLKIPNDMAEQECLYDGEKTVETTYSPNKDRDGRSLSRPNKDDKAGKINEGYRTAYIQNGLFPAPRGPKMLRNPLTYMDEMFVNTLEKALEQQTAIKIARNADKSLKLTFSYTTNQPALLTYAVTLDPRKGWVVTEINCTGKDGGILSEALCRYQSADDRLWVPKDGFYRSYNSSQEPKRRLPRLEWRYQVLEIKVNDLSFPANAFDVVLKPDTLVNDARYKATYRIGAEAAFDAKLKELAQSALDSKNQVPVPKEERPRSSFLRRAIIVNIIVLVVIFAVFIMRYKRRSTPV